MNFDIYGMPIPLDDLRAIEQMLAADNLICSAFTPQRFDAYSCLAYRYQKVTHELEITFIMDRNIFTRIIALIRGDAVKANEEKSYRLCAAAMAFFHCGDVRIEPCISLLEPAYKDKEKAEEELKLFRIQDSKL